MFRGFIGLFLLMHSSASLLFEQCDKLYELNDDNPVTINSQNFSLGEQNISSCRFVFAAPTDYIVELNCSIRMDQFDSSNCPMKRFFIQNEGVRELHDAEYFCNQNGTERTIRRRSIMNRIVAAYATQANVTDEKFNCTAKRVQTECDCGWSRKTRVVGGKNAELHEFPSIIALLAISINKVFCGGVLISDRWALSGAHCFNDVLFSNLSNVAVYIGEHDIRVENETIYTEIHEIEKYIRHPQYTFSRFEQSFDISLIKFKRRVSFNRAVGPACLPFGFNASSFDEKFVTIAGFGYKTFNGPLADVLQKASVQILPAKGCLDSSKEPQKMCTYTADKDSCISDSGGPLYFTQSRQIVVGLVSYGVLCGTSTPSVNTRLVSYLPWIEATTEGEKFCRKKFA